MSASRPSALASAGSYGASRTRLLVMPGGPDAPSAGFMADELAAETEELLETLEGTVARLALAHRSCTTGVEDQAVDDEAFAWVQQSLEDISATLRCLTLGRAVDGETSAPAELPVATELA